MLLKPPCSALVPRYTLYCMHFESRLGRLLLLLLLLLLLSRTSQPFQLAGAFGGLAPTEPTQLPSQGHEYCGLLQLCQAALPTVTPLCGFLELMNIEEQDGLGSSRCSKVPQGSARYMRLAKQGTAKPATAACCRPHNSYGWYLASTEKKGKKALPGIIHAGPHEACQGCIINIASIK
jgi:hypothetical protein